eukprot:CAMPEP_0178915924 /NCGR_PEP_ID=MMETSP0786-20121207/12321_1 /TAXON_ID=186022 /ORGANISM="Thalassionema frauenfeldii, Strain CCMP 1798" /LENGTH=30 /DNA_ID= /DNA_START= /DNA_END= /DNA_ORIENTATION=
MMLLATYSPSSSSGPGMIVDRDIGGNIGDI